jgi:hypothetical protein
MDMFEFIDRQPNMDEALASYLFRQVRFVFTIIRDSNAVRIPCHSSLYLGIPFIPTYRSSILIYLFFQVVDAVAYLHSKSILHRDVKVTAVL